ncbi:hypothetical protein L0F63_001352, partial [Massospora cicadina]
KLSNEVSLLEPESGKLEEKIEPNQDLLKSIKIELESLQDTEMLLKSQNDQILKLHEQAAAKANAIAAKKNELLDKVESVLSNIM